MSHDPAQRIMPKARAAFTLCGRQGGPAAERWAVPAHPGRIVTTWGGRPPPVRDSARPGLQPRCRVAILRVSAPPVVHNAPAVPMRSAQGHAGAYAWVTPRRCNARARRGNGALGGVLTPLRGLFSTPRAPLVDLSTAFSTVLPISQLTGYRRRAERRLTSLDLPTSR